MQGRIPLRTPHNLPIPPPRSSPSHPTPNLAPPHPLIPSAPLPLPPLLQARRLSPIRAGTRQLPLRPSTPRYVPSRRPALSTPHATGALRSRRKRRPTFRSRYCSASPRPVLPTAATFLITTRSCALTKARPRSSSRRCPRRSNTPAPGPTTPSDPSSAWTLPPPPPHLHQIT
jgi:hypothetical protein